MANEGVGITGEERQECLELQQKEMEVCYQISAAASIAPEVESEEAQLDTSNNTSSRPKKRAVWVDQWVKVTPEIHQQLDNTLPYLEKRTSQDASTYGEIQINIGGKQVQENPYLSEALLKRMHGPALKPFLLMCFYP